MRTKERYRVWAAANREHLRQYQRAWRSRNRDRLAAYRRKHYKYDPVKAKDKWLRRRFGISLVEYQKMRAAQKPGCAICPAKVPGGRGTWHTDHDHKTGRVRQLLCQNCNIGLGNFQDNPRLLEKAAAYLRKHKN